MGWTTPLATNALEVKSCGGGGGCERSQKFQSLRGATLLHMVLKVLLRNVKTALSLDSLLGMVY